jgi:hypothetical protein
LGIEGRAAADMAKALSARGGTRGDTKPARAETAPRQRAAAMEYWASGMSFFISGVVTFNEFKRIAKDKFALGLSTIRLMHSS